MGPEGLEPSPAGLKVRYAAVTPRPQKLAGRMRFHRVCFIILLLVSSGSPESRTQHYAVISRVWATGPQLPFCQRRCLPGRDGGTRTRVLVPPRHAGCRCPTSRHPVRTGGFEPRGGKGGSGGGREGAKRRVDELRRWVESVGGARGQSTIPATDPTKKARCRWDTGLSVFSRNRDGQVSQAQWIKRGIRRLIGGLYPSIFAVRDSAVLKSWLFLGQTLAARQGPPRCILSYRRR